MSEFKGKEEESATIRTSIRRPMPSHCRMSSQACA